MTFTTLSAFCGRHRRFPFARRLTAVAALALPSLVVAGDAASDDTLPLVVSRAEMQPREREAAPAVAIHPGTANVPTAFTSQIDALDDEAGTAQEISRRLQSVDLGNYAIDVSVSNGVATLDGFVLDEESRGRAAKIAQQVDGVKSIRNRIITRLRQAAAEGRDVAQNETMSKESAAKDAAFRKAMAVKKADARKKADTGKGAGAGDRSQKHPPSPPKDRDVTVNVIININVDSGNHYGPPPRSAGDGDRPDRPAGFRENADERQRSFIEQMMQRFRGGEEGRANAPGSPEFREELERRQREMEQHREDMRQRMEQMHREMRERAEQRDREFEARRHENEVREDEVREHERREGERREQEARNNAERRNAERREAERRERESFLEDETRRDREPREREREELEAPRG